MEGVVISIIGGSGSGKDTQATKLSQHFDIPHLSMGAILREQDRLGNPLAQKAVEILNEGNWVPDEITSKILEDYVMEHAQRGFIITGYPRPPEQRKSFAKILEKMQLKLGAVVHIRVPDEILLDRMHKQLKEQHETTDKRGDTSDTAMLQRLKSYHDTINPILDHYREEGVLLDIDGTPTIDEVFSTILSGLENLGVKK
jgi:adenylate kinase